MRGSVQDAPVWIVLICAFVCGMCAVEAAHDNPLGWIGLLVYDIIGGIFLGRLTAC